MIASVPGFARRLPRLSVFALAGTVCVFVSQEAWATHVTATIIYDFSAPQDGVIPQGGLVADAQGRLYGTTSVGGPLNGGTVFRLNPPTNAGSPWTEELLHTFGGNNPDGGGPQAGVTLGPDGSVYGTTVGGGDRGRGVAFKLANQPGWPITILHQFALSGAVNPKTLLVFGPGGLLYGGSGYSNLGFPADFSVSPLGDSVEYSAITFGAQTAVSLGLTAVPGQSGLLGITTPGIMSSPTFYTLAANGTGGMRVKTQYTFGPPPDVGSPNTPLTLGTSALEGSAFGCGSYGGAHNQGGVYQITRQKNGTFNESVIFSFPDPTDPYAVAADCSVLQANPTGTLIGITGSFTNGAPINQPANFVFQLTPPTAPGGAWTETPLLSFFTGNSGNPVGPSWPIARIGNAFYIAFSNDNGLGIQRGAVVQLTLTP